MCHLPPRLGFYPNARQPPPGRRGQRGSSLSWIRVDVGPTHLPNFRFVAGAQHTAGASPARSTPVSIRRMRCPISPRSASRAADACTKRGTELCTSPSPRPSGRRSFAIACLKYGAPVTLSGDHPPCWRLVIDSLVPSSLRSRRCGQSGTGRNSVAARLAACGHGATQRKSREGKRGQK